MIRKIFPLALMLLAVSGPARAQTDTASQLRVGDKVRLRARHGEGRWWVGTVAALSPDTLWMQRHNSLNRLAFPFATTGELEVSRGRKSNFLPGLGYGTLGGAVFFGLVGLMSGDDPEDSFVSLKATDKALIGAAVGGAVGAVLGGLFGALSPGDRWEAVQLDRVEVDVAGGFDGRIWLTFSYGF